MNAPTGYEFWRAALAGHEPPIDMNQLRFGFYQNRRRNEPPTAIAIFPHQGHVFVREVDRQGNAIDWAPDNALQPWPFWAARPITEESWRYYLEHRHFPEEIEGEVATFDPRQHADPFELLLDQITNATQAALGEIKEGIEDQLQADRAANHRDRLLELEKRCNLAFKAEKQPLDDQLAQIRGKWKAPLLELSNAIAFIRNALTPFLQAQRAAAKAAAPHAEVKAKAGTGRRRTGLRTHVSAHVIDWQAAAIALLDHPDLKAEIQRLANKVYVAGGELPGCEKVERETAQ